MVVGDFLDATKSDPARNPPLLWIKGVDDVHDFFESTRGICMNPSLFK